MNRNDSNNTVLYGSDNEVAKLLWNKYENISRMLMEIFALMKIYINFNRSND